MWLPLDTICKIRRSAGLLWRATTPVRNRLSTLTRELIMVIIDCIRPLLGPAGCCRFSPTCSEYARQELHKGPLLRALWAIITRLSQCHPFGYFLHSHTHSDKQFRRVPPMSPKNDPIVPGNALFDASTKNSRAQEPYEL